MLNDRPTAVTILLMITARLVITGQCLMLTTDQTASPDKSSWHQELSEVEDAGIGFLLPAKCGVVMRLVTSVCLSVLFVL